MNWLGRYRLLILASICVFWTGLIFLGHFFPMCRFFRRLGVANRVSRICFESEGRKTAAPNDFVFLGLDQSTLQMPLLTPEEVADNRAFQLMTERPFPWSREVWALLLDRLFGAGARVVIFDDFLPTAQQWRCGISCRAGSSIATKSSWPRTSILWERRAGGHAK